MPVLWFIYKTNHSILYLYHCTTNYYRRCSLKQQKLIIPVSVDQIQGRCDQNLSQGLESFKSWHQPGLRCHLGFGVLIQAQWLWQNPFHCSCWAEACIFFLAVKQRSLSATRGHQHSLSWDLFHFQVNNRELFSHQSSSCNNSLTCSSASSPINNLPFYYPVLLSSLIKTKIIYQIIVLD